MKDIKEELIEKTVKWLGKDGIDFFKQCKKKHGKVDACFLDGGIPHPVHWREGMQVRNFLRGLDECKDWGAHKLDDSWVDIIEKIL